MVAWPKDLVAHLRFVSTSAHVVSTLFSLYVCLCMAVRLPPHRTGVKIAEIGCRDTQNEHTDLGRLGLVVNSCVQSGVN